MKIALGSSAALRDGAGRKLNRKGLTFYQMTREGHHFLKPIVSREISHATRWLFRKKSPHDQKILGAQL